MNRGLFRPTALFKLLLLFAVTATAQEPGGAMSIDWSAARQFWSFQAPLRHPRPPVEQVSWPTQPIDWFVLERLERAGLRPAHVADRATMIRRVTLDLTG